MRLALSIGHWFGWPFQNDLALTREAERLGFASVWAAEAYGSDCVTVLSWLAGQTSSIGLGSAIMQIPARTAAMTGMTAATLDVLSQGRFHLGLGVSGPQVSEGWHGVPFAKPLGRTREYVDVVRMILAKQQVAYDGQHITLPLPDGPGKSLRLSFRPFRSDLPIYLAAVGPKNLELAGEIADGWLGIFYCPEYADHLLADVRRGALAAGRGTAQDPLADFDVCPLVPVVVDDDVQAAADQVRGYTALYVGGMGSRQQNFYNAMARRLGFEEAAAEIQDLYLAGRQRDAAAAVPFELIDATALIGPPARIRERMTRYARGGVTTVMVSPYGGSLEQRISVLRTVADAL
ncbi:MAG: LLM class F420-dependent oxidoreductase [Austwickia sp.]|nr:LLM class F420-dependent oxidoreductase [Austwickia sp.]MBK8435313.1 LLM class F420-dependent oxidoreductase [Austwickia sp.]MBK9101137.1 LLM class F420-dependent oxidoreductase [Austwickia sp.]